MRLTERKVTAVLRQNGYKITPQRRVLIRTIVARRDHLTPADIYRKVHKEYPNIGLVTIYRTLEILAGLHLICELHAGGNCRSYTISAPQEHHHLICSKCGIVVDCAGYNLDDLERRIAKESGFRIDDHLLEFTGLCQACQKAA
jgi:Fur family ferric uptake transcriptional regulator